MAEEPRIPVGEVVGVFGLRGAIKVHPLTDFVSQRFAVGAVVEAAGTPRRIVSCFDHKGQLRVQLRGIETVEQAEALRGEKLWVPESQLPRLEPGEYMARHLVGLRVLDRTRGEIGTVQAVQQGAAQDLIVIPGTRFPAVSAFIKRVDLEAGVMEVDLIPGLGAYEDQDVVEDRK
jgi:16S rRNA processing protein RimM